MTEERLEHPEYPSQAIKIIKLLIEFGCPKDSSEVSGWLKQVELLQTLLSNIWQSDPTGKTMVKCLNFLYNVIALNITSVSPAVWTILGLVDDDKIADFVEGILSDSMTNADNKVQNVLIAIIEGLCQCGPYIPRLKEWIPAIVRGLEERKNFAVLVNVSEKMIGRLTKTLIMPIFRPITYPIFKQFLYPVTTPHVFHKIIDGVPEVLNFLQKDFENDETKEICLDLCGLIKTLLMRFPSDPTVEPKYNAIKIVIMKMPYCDFESDSLILWDMKLNRNQADCISDAHCDVNYEIKANLPPYKGLINQGNTCFMNSVLQVLFMTTRFRMGLLEMELDPSERAARDLQHLFAFMQESKRSVLSPNGVLESTLPPTFRRGQQQDSSEYLIYLLDTLHENEKKIVKRRKTVNSTVKNGLGETKREEESTLVDRLFGGASLSTTVCSHCKKSFSKKEEFRELHLSIPDSMKCCELQNLIDDCLRPEELHSENMYDCAGCGTKRNATRSHVIIKPPQHLILTLKLFRFDSERKQRLKVHCKLKNTKTIQVPVFNSSQLQTGSVVYEVKGVVLHSGSSLDGGHYFSSAIDQFGQWYIFNDSLVSQAGCEWNRGGGSPYILILRQSSIADLPVGPLLSNLQLLVNRDNQKYLAEKKYRSEGSAYLGKRNYDDDDDDDDDDDWKDPPSTNGPMGGPGPSLVF